MYINVTGNHRSCTFFSIKYDLYETELLKEFSAILNNPIKS